MLLVSQLFVQYRRQNRRIALVSAILLLILTLLVSHGVPSPSLVRPVPSGAELLGGLPMSFEANGGQVDSTVAFTAHTSASTLYFTPSGVTLSLRRGSSHQPAPAGSGARGERASLASSTTGEVSTNVVRMSFAGTGPHASLSPGSSLPGKVNYLIGNDPSRWHIDLPTYSSIVYGDLYSGVQLTYSGKDGSLKGTYSISAQADAGSIRWSYAGADNLSLDSGGNLVISLPGSPGSPTSAADTLIEQAPVAWQDIHGSRVSVPISYNLLSGGYISFSIGQYDRHYPLTIDPSLTYSTYLGGSGLDWGVSLALDSAGNTYITGKTNSTNFPTTPGAYHTSNAGSLDVFLTKLNEAGSALVYSTYYGGSGDDYAHDVIVDHNGYAYITGLTSSSNLPVVSAYQASYGGGTSDSFVAKFNPSGSALAYSTYLGGAGADQSTSIDIDASGNAYITGYTDSTNFPATSGAFRTSNAGGNDAFVTKLGSSGSSLVYSTYIGGASSDQCNGIAVDGAGNAYLTGYTLSSDFPTRNPIQASYGGNGDALIFKLNSTGSDLFYSTYLGGSGVDNARVLVIDAGGNTDVTGETDSANFPTTTGAFQRTVGGLRDAFVTKVSASGSSWVYSTYVGGNGDDYLGQESNEAMAVDASGNVYITGSTTSTNFPLANPIQSTLGGGTDAYITKMNPTGTGLVYSSYLGGSGNDEGHGLAADGAGNIFVTGFTDSTNFPTTPGAFRRTYSGGSDTFISKIFDSSGLTVPVLDLPINYGNDPSNFRRDLQAAANGGRVNSWFDHNLPRYNLNGSLTLWNGQDTQLNYDGHNGIDLVRDSHINLYDIHAAADGVVADSKPDCTPGDFTNGCRYYGNYVVIYHAQTGYFTMYGHMKEGSVHLTPGTPVHMGDPVGIMGHTGHVIPNDERGTHLHFGVYRDSNGNGQWDNNLLVGDESHDLPVDPYGWTSTSQYPQDPWIQPPYNGPASYYLWRFDQSSRQSFDGGQGTSINNTTVNAEAIIPPGAFTGSVVLELAPGAADAPSGQLRSTGHTFGLHLLDGLRQAGTPQKGQGSHSTGASPGTPSFPLSTNIPYTITITYADSELQYLDPAQLTIAWYNDVQGVWQPIPSTIDTANHQVTAHTTDLGQFDLLAPLSCSGDAYELDESYAVARSVLPTDWPLQRALNSSTDQDWVAFHADLGATYDVSTFDLAPGAVTVLNILDSDGTTILATNTSSSPAGSQITWVAPHSGDFFLQVLSGSGGSTGCSAAYKLSASIVACTLTFSDVQSTDPFYVYTRCLSCRSILGGYADGTFRPGNNVTRGQLSKIVSNGAGFSEPHTEQLFEDVTVGSTFYDFIARLASRSIIGGYPCGGDGEPCMPPGNLPYFRPSTNATRGQISKIISNAAGFSDTPTGQTFEDVSPSSPFYLWVERLASLGIMSGYPCGGEGEPCVAPDNRPYFRPGNNATRGQIAKMVSNSFFPNCQTP